MMIVTQEYDFCQFIQPYPIQQVIRLLSGFNKDGMIQLTTKQTIIADLARLVKVVNAFLLLRTPVSFDQCSAPKRKK